MGFILEKTSGKGEQEIKITPDSKNTTKVAVNKNLQVQVNGVTKAVVQLIQKARVAVIKALCSCDKNSINGLGDEIKISYWATEDRDIISDDITLEVLSSTTAVYSEISNGTNPDGTKYKVFKIEENSGESNRTFQVQSTYSGGDTGIQSEVLTLTQGIAAVDIICIASTALIPPTGGTAKITYYAKSGNDIITDGVELEILPGTSDAPQPTFSQSEGINPLTGNYVELLIGSNTINKTKYIRARAKYNEKYSKEVSIRQVGKDATVLPDFNFFCFTYGWGADAGKDLDSMTIIQGTGIMIDGKPLDDYPVGWNMGSGNTNTEVQKYIKWGGDNTQSGAEGAEINWKALCERDFISEGIYTIYAKVYGNWYNTKGTGVVTFNLSTYKGTGMIQDGYTFKPDDTTVLVTKQEHSVVCYAQGRSNARPTEEGLNAKDCYSLLATLEYDVASKAAVLIMNPNAANSGRDQGAGDTEPKQNPGENTRMMTLAIEEPKVESEGEPW
ncbi:MAG: hypothetical protein NC131_06255 [Roseburia sp.]|nr:hypothetical protein [Roseburia sp.]